MSDTFHSDRIQARIDELLGCDVRAMAPTMRDEWLEAAAASHRREKQGQAECMKSEVRILSSVVIAYFQERVTDGLFVDPVTLEQR